MADFDLAIVGGGINGTGIARDAAGRGGLRRRAAAGQPGHRGDSEDADVGERVDLAPDDGLPEIEQAVGPAEAADHAARDDRPAEIADLSRGRILLER